MNGMVTMQMPEGTYLNTQVSSSSGRATSAKRKSGGVVRNTKRTQRAVSCLVPVDRDFLGFLLQVLVFLMLLI